MAERPRRMRRQVSDITEPTDSSEESAEETDTRRQDASRRGKSQIATSPTTSRSKRASAGGTVARATTSPSNDSNKSTKLTMKIAPSKLREVMRANEVDGLKDTLGGGRVLEGPRSRRSAAQAQLSSPTSTRSVPNKPRYQEYAESEIDDAEEDEDEDDAEAEVDAGEDTMMDDVDETGLDAEGESEEEDDDDAEMEEDTPQPVKKNQVPPRAPKITLKTPSKAEQKQGIQPKVVVTPADVGPVKSVEDVEMEDDPDDDEVDESSALSGDEDNDQTNLNDEDAEGEDEEEEELEGGMEGEGGDGAVGEEEDDDDDDDDLDSDDETPGSGMQTPDPGRMTQRQRGRAGEELMALDMAPQQRKFFTDAEKAMKKDEHARKRKELTKRRTQEEKTAALNRLLKPQVSKTRGAAPKAETLAAQMQAAAEEEIIQEKANPLYTRWISTKDGVQLGVPGEWLGKRVGAYFGPPPPSRNGALVQEVE